MLKENINLVFLGDSLTQRTGIIQSSNPSHRFSLDYSGSYVDVLIKRIIVNFPNIQFEYHNKGMGGNTVKDLLGRVQKDVISLHPDYVFLFIGQNDANLLSPDDFKKDLDTLLDIFKSGNLKIIQYSTTPSPGNPGKNMVLDRYDEVIKGLCAEYNNPYVDIKNNFLEVEELNANKDIPLVLFNDGCHMSELGNILIADKVFEAILHLELW